jgi:hypothetical protein
VYIKNYLPQKSGDAVMKKEKQLSVILLFIISFFTSEASPSQAGIIDDLYGAWIKKSTGEIVYFRNNGNAAILPSPKYNEIKSIKYLQCSKYGGNLCFTNDKIKCAYRYSFTQGVMNLQYRYTVNDNVPVCMSLYGDYTKVDN